MSNVLFGEFIERKPYTLMERFKMFEALNELDRLRMVLVLSAVVLVGLALAFMWYKMLYAPKRLEKGKLKLTYFMQALYWVFALYFTLNTFLPVDNYDTIIEDNQPTYNMYLVNKERYVKDGQDVYKVNGWRLEEVPHGVIIPTEK